MESQVSNSQNESVLYLWLERLRSGIVTAEINNNTLPLKL